MAQSATRYAPLQPASRRTEALALVSGVGMGLVIVATLLVAETIPEMAAPKRAAVPPEITLALSKFPAAKFPAAEYARAPAILPASRIRIELASLHGQAPAPRARPARYIVPAAAPPEPTAFEPTPPGPSIALIIDDMGLDAGRAAAVIGLGGPLTLSYLPYAKDLRRQTRAARAAGHELMLHLPMEPRARRADPGPNVLAAWLPPNEIARRLRWALESFDGYVGVNNHMGSLFTANRAAMRLVLGNLRVRNLLFVDSRTGPGSVARSVAGTMGLRFAERDVFLDHEADDRPVAARLKELEAIATRTGIAIGIGHPRRLTIAALKQWIPDVLGRGFRLVRISTVARRLPAPQGEQRLSSLVAGAG